MKYKRYRFLLLMLVTVWNITARGATQITYDGIIYSIDETTNTAKVARQNNSSLSSVNIPSTVNYNGNSYTVTIVDNYAFYNCRNLTSVILPSTIQAIGDYGFGNCNELSSINIPEGVTTIGRDAFYYCRKMLSITLPSSLTSLGESAFENCSSLTEITIPNGHSMTVLIWKKSLFQTQLPKLVLEHSGIAATSSL